MFREGAAHAESFVGAGFRVLHIGAAVPALGPAAESLGALFGYEAVSGPFDDPIQRVTVLFLARSAQDPVEIELIAPLGEDSPVRSMLGKNGGGAYHLCLETADLDGAQRHVEQRGCIVVAHPAPAVAFGGRRIAWIYTSGRQLFELVEAEAAAAG